MNSCMHFENTSVWVRSNSKVKCNNAFRIGVQQTMEQCTHRTHPFHVENQLTEHINNKKELKRIPNKMKCFRFESLAPISIRIRIEAEEGKRKLKFNQIVTEAPPASMDLLKCTWEFRIH